MTEAEALLLDRTLRLSQQETEMEQGWLLQEMEQCFGYSLDELARRFDRGVRWVSQRLALVELLPEAIQQQVRVGKIAAQLAMKYLAPVARINVEDCARMAAAFAAHRCTTREAGQLYTAWREGSRVVRERILSSPELFLKTQRQPQTPAATAAAALARDLEMAAAIVQRANRRLGVALTEMNGAHLEQAQQKIEQARRELDRMAQRIRKEQEEKHAEQTATHGTILELHTRKVSILEIARVLKVSRPSVRKVLHSNSAAAPPIPRQEKAEPHRQRILDLLAQCKGNLVRVHCAKAKRGTHGGRRNPVVCGADRLLPSSGDRAKAHCAVGPL